MDHLRYKLLIRLIGVVAAISVLCILTIFIMKSCSTSSEEPTNEEIEEQQEDAPPEELPEVESPAEGGCADGFIDYEDTSAFPSTGNYENDKVLTYDYGGGTISIGVEGLGVQDYIYLNPTCSEARAEAGGQVGFFITASSPRLDFCYKSGGAATDGVNAAEANLIVLGQTYDTAAPAGYKTAEDYGVRWERDALDINNDNGGTILYIRAVNLSNGKLIAMCKATIVYDTQRDLYILDSIGSSDVVDTGEMTAEEKADLVQAAADFMKETGNFMPPKEENWEEAKLSAKVEHVPAPYFTRFSDIDGQQATSFENPYNKCEVWAVNMQFPSGFITVYFAPYLQSIGFDSATRPGSDELNLTIIGYDCLNPMSQDTILW